MRTTVTIDDDVAAKLKADARKRGISFKEALNDNLRRGLTSPDAKSVPFKVRPRKMGVKPGVDLDKALSLAGRLEDEEVLRKISLRK